MTKQDYEVIAYALRQVIGGNYIDCVDSLVKYLKEDNDKFDIEKFYDACGVQSPMEKSLAELKK